MRQLAHKQPFTVFVLGGSQVSIPISTFCVFLSGTPFSFYGQVVTALSTVEDILHILVQRQIIPADYRGVCTLSYGRIGSLLGQSTMASLGVGSLSHFCLRTHVHGGAGKFLSMFYHMFYLLPFCRTCARTRRIISVIQESRCPNVSQKDMCETDTVR